jgi:hypothetical protein
VLYSSSVLEKLKLHNNLSMSHTGIYDDRIQTILLILPVNDNKHMTRSLETYFHRNEICIVLISGQLR